MGEGEGRGGRRRMRDEGGRGEWKGKQDQKDGEEEGREKDD